MAQAFDLVDTINNLGPRPSHSVRSHLTLPSLVVDIVGNMDVERVIDDIEQLEEMFEAPDIRPLSASDISAANRRHDERLASSPWFRLWQHFGVCCRTDSPTVQLGELDS